MNIYLKYHDTTALMEIQISLHNLTTAFMKGKPY